MKRLISSLLFVMLMAGWTAVSAETVWKVEQKETKGSESSTSTLTFGKDKMKADHGDGQMAVIMDFGKDKMYNIVHARKMYIEINISELKKQMDMVMKMMQAKMGGEKAYSLKQTKEKKTINGFEAQKVVVQRDGKIDATMWVSPKAASKEIMKTYARFFEMMGGQQSGPTGPIAAMKQAFDIGMPVRIEIEGENGEGKAVTEVVKITKMEAGKDVFDPPTAYTKRTMEEMMRQMMQMQGQPGPGGPGGIVPPQQGPMGQPGGQPPMMQ